LFISPPALSEAQVSRAYVLLVFFKIFNIYFCDFFQTNYLNIYRADLHEICVIGRTLAVDEQTGAIFSIPQGTLPWQPIFWAKSTLFRHLVVRMTFARAAPPAFNNMGNCYAGHRQTNYPTRWTQANQLADQLIEINRRQDRKAGGLPSGFALHLVVPCCRGREDAMC